MGGIFCTKFSNVIFNLLAGLIFLLAIAGYLMGVAAGKEALQMLIVGFAVFEIKNSGLFLPA